MSDLPSITAIALFFDDIRFESNNKLILIGQYASDMIVSPGSLPVDRLSILLHVRWPLDFTPKTVIVRVSVPGQPPMVQPLPTSDPIIITRPKSEFSSVIMQGIVQLRFPPLRAGDTIDVWVQLDGHDIPAGRLHISAPSSLGSATPGISPLAI